ncbi:MAG: universal stress protein [Pseudonocardiales bacterium]|nr:universal stress protein [Pseudonocardiales bacterium]
MRSATAPGAVVVGVDGSAAALRAVRWAAVQARSAWCSVSLVHTLEWPVVSFPVAELPVDWTQEIHQQGHRWLHEARQAAERAAPGVHVQVYLFTGDPRERLLAEAHHAREVVVGSRGLGGVAGMLLGSTSAALAQHASCPVVVVHGDGQATGPVVVGLDGSAASAQALAYAFPAASRAGAVLLAVHGWGGAGAPDCRLVQVDERAVEEIEAAAQRMLADQLAGWPEKYPRVAVLRKVIHQRPAAALIELGHQARMIVVGSRGRGGFARLLLGSISQAVLRHATCPVVVCHRKPEDSRPSGG